MGYAIIDIVLSRFKRKGGHINKQVLGLIIGGILGYAIVNTPLGAIVGAVLGAYMTSQIQK